VTIESLDGRVAVVTGGASGIGRGIAAELAGRGVSVAIADLHEGRIEETTAELQDLGAAVIGMRCDVSRDEDVTRFRDAVLEHFGQVDLLCNNAGVSVLGPPWSVELADWEWILQINVLGLVRGVRAFVPAMVERGSGHVVNTASIAGTWAYTWDCAPYITSKFAAYGYSEVLARSLRPLGVGVSVLCPGLVLTNIGENVRVSGVPEDRASEWGYFPEEMMVPVTPAEVGSLVADAVQAGTFAIFTHASDAERFRTWRADIEGELTSVIDASPSPPRLP
jgi:NAD(P)-dependent dehydrogenase (short-subunit alcohol dehydrogenase family)